MPGLRTYLGNRPLGGSPIPVHADATVLALGRVPTFPTVMALLHRKEPTLPHGRARRCKRIAEACLDSADACRGVSSVERNLAQKMRWLARVGYEMQRRSARELRADTELKRLRSRARSSTVRWLRRIAGQPHLFPHEAGVSPDEIYLGDQAAEPDTAHAHEIVSWVDAEMKHGNYRGQTSARRFLDFVRRSGLLVEWSEGRYAFVQTSLQQFFAAIALERGLTEAWRDTVSRQAQRSTLAEWARSSVWCETFVLLFELIAARKNCLHSLLDHVFAEGFTGVAEEPPDDDPTLAELLAAVVTNPHSGLSRSCRYAAMLAAVRAAAGFASRSPGRAPEPCRILVRLLNGDSRWTEKVLSAVGTQAHHKGALRLSLEKAPIANIKPLAGCRSLRALDLRGARVADIGALWSQTRLEWLDLSGTGVADLRPIANLTALRELYLDDSPVENLAPLASRPALRRLHLNGTQVPDLEPLADLKVLDSLRLCRTRVAELAPLAGLKALRRLELDDTEVSDLRPLMNLPALEHLGLEETQVSDLRPLGNLAALKTLGLSRTGVSDLHPLANLPVLRLLDLRWTEVSDLGPLASLLALKSLSLEHTRVRDLGPLGDLEGLNHLGLDQTPVPGVESLAACAALKHLDLRRTAVSDLRPLASLAKLDVLRLSGTQVADLEPLGGATALTQLFVDHTRVLNLGPLVDLSTLELLDLTGTPVVDLRPLARIATLRVLVLRGTRVSKRMIEELRMARPECAIIETLSELAEMPPTGRCDSLASRCSALFHHFSLAERRARVPFRHCKKLNRTNPN